MDATYRRLRLENRNLRVRVRRLEIGARIRDYYAQLHQQYQRLCTCASRQPNQIISREVQTVAETKQTTSKHVQTEANTQNSKTIIVPKARKDSKKLGRRGLFRRRKEVELAFQETAALVEGRIDGQNGELEKITVSFQFWGGKTESFLAKSGAPRVVAGDDGVSGVDDGNDVKGMVLPDRNGGGVGDPDRGGPIGDRKGDVLLADTGDGKDGSRPVDEGNGSRPPVDNQNRSRPVDDRNDQSRPVDDRNGSRPVDDRERSSPVSDRNGSRPVDDGNGSRPVDDREGSRPVDDGNGSRPVDDRDGSRPVDDRDGSRPVDDRDGSRPEDDRDGSRPVHDRDGSRPVDDRDGSRPVDDRDGSRPVHDRDGSRPEDDQNGSRPVDDRDGSRPVDDRDGSRPEDDQNGSRPVDDRDGSRPVDDRDGSRPVDDRDGSRPVDDREGSRPVDDGNGSRSDFDDWKIIGPIDDQSGSELEDDRDVGGGDSDGDAEDVETIRKKEHVDKILEVKVRNRISYSALHEMRMCGLAAVPPTKVMEKRYEQLASNPQVLPVKILMDGKQTIVNAAMRKIRDVLHECLKWPKYKKYINEKKELLLRFASDGAKISKLKDAVRAGIKLIMPREEVSSTSVISTSPDDEHTLLFYLGTEERDQFKAMSAQIFLDMQELTQTGITVDGEHIRIKWIYCCDWKAMQITRGINQANADYFCLWCECTKRQILDFSVPDWPVTRKPTRQQECLQKAGRAARRGYTDQDLLPWIPFENMVPDELHLKIRITGKLLNQVVRWSIDCKKEKLLLKEMKRIGVSFKFHQDQRREDGTAGDIRWTQPSGDVLQKILENFRIDAVFGLGRILLGQRVEQLSIHELKRQLTRQGLPSLGVKANLIIRLKATLQPGEKIIVPKRNAERVDYDFSDEEAFDSDDDLAAPDAGRDSVDIGALQDVWKGFAELLSFLQAKPGTGSYVDHETFQDHARAWAKQFRRVTFDKDIIPYIHCLVYHVPQALDRFRYLPDIGISQVERRNYDNHLAYFGATSREGGRKRHHVTMELMTVSQQILERENVLMFFNLKDDVDAPPVKKRKKKRKVVPLDPY